MRINFRQGLVSSKVSDLGQPDFLTTNPQGVMLNGAETPLTFTICDGPKNYTIAINASFVAWPVSLFTDVTEAWLYVDVNRATANVTYGIVTSQPHYGPTAPASPVEGAMWFNTIRLENSVYNSSVGRWFPALRVLAGHFTTTSINEVATGTQVGLVGSSVTSGQIVWDGLGRALLDSSGRFFTTEDIILIAGVESHAAKLESNVITGSAAEPIPEFHVVRFNVDGDVELADYDNVGDSVLGLSVVSGTAGNPINMVLSGLVYNPAWSWSGPNVTLWVNQTGQLSHIDPYELGGRAKRRVPVARTIDTHTIIFDQGMGGVGEQGEAGTITGLPVASGAVIGITQLSVDPEDPLLPVAVGTNDPRLTDPRVPLEHTHPATSITVSPFGTFNGTNAQQSLEHLQTVKLNLSGGTVTGNVISTVTATQDNHLVTLGKAKSEITALAVTERRYVLSSQYSTIVQAFNALSPANRTLPVNTVVVLEWKGSMYMWAGGYGTPVSATDSAQFLLIGRLITDTPPLTFKTIEAITTYVDDSIVDTVVVILFMDGDDGAKAATMDLSTGVVTPFVDTGTTALAFNNGGFSATTNEIAYGEYSYGLRFYDVATMQETYFLEQSGATAYVKFSKDGSRGTMIHPGYVNVNDIQQTQVSVFDATTKSIVYTSPGTDSGGPNHDSSNSMWPVPAITSNGEILVYTRGFSTTTDVNHPMVTLERVNLTDSTTASLPGARFRWVGVAADDMMVVSTNADDGNGTKFYMFDPINGFPNALPPTPDAVLPPQWQLDDPVAVVWNGVHYVITHAYDGDTSVDTIFFINMEDGTNTQLVLGASTGIPWRVAVNSSNTVVLVGLYFNDANTETIWTVDPSTASAVTQTPVLPDGNYYNEFILL